MSVKTLQSWKEIANYLGRGVRTVQRWEKYGLPVHRPAGKHRSAVFALEHEVDAWLAATEVRLDGLENGTSAEQVFGDRDALMQRVCRLEAENARLQAYAKVLSQKLGSLIAPPSDLAGRKTPLAA